MDILKKIIWLGDSRKKSTQGIRTPKHEIDLIQQRLKEAYLLAGITR